MTAEEFGLEQVRHLSYGTGFWLKNLTTRIRSCLRNWPRFVSEDREESRQQSKARERGRQAGNPPLSLARVCVTTPFSCIQLLTAVIQEAYER